jgi:hypothetical protein
MMPAYSRSDIQALLAQAIIRTPKHWREILETTRQRLTEAGLMKDPRRHIPNHIENIPDSTTGQQELLVSHVKGMGLNVAIVHAVIEVADDAVREWSDKPTRLQEPTNDFSTELSGHYRTNGAFTPFMQSAAPLWQSCAKRLMTNPVWGPAFTMRHMMYVDYVTRYFPNVPICPSPLYFADSLIVEQVLNIASTIYFTKRHLATIDPSIAQAAPIDQILTEAVMYRADRTRGAHRKLLSHYGVRLAIGDGLYACGAPPTKQDRQKYNFPRKYVWRGDEFGAWLYKSAARRCDPNAARSHKPSTVPTTNCPAIARPNPAESGSTNYIAGDELMRPFISFVLSLDQRIGGPLSTFPTTGHDLQLLH